MEAMTSEPVTTVEAKRRRCCLVEKLPTFSVLTKPPLREEIGNQLLCSGPDCPLWWYTEDWMISLPQGIEPPEDDWLFDYNVRRNDGKYETVWRRPEHKNTGFCWFATDKAETYLEEGY